MFIKQVRLGRDAEVAYLQSGTAVVNFSGAYDVGWGDSKKTQWVRFAWFGDRAVKAAPYLLKGKAVIVYADDLHLEQYDGPNGTSHNIKATITKLDFAAGGQNQDAGQAQQAPQRQAAPQVQHQAPPAPPAAGFDDDDIPF